MQGAVTKSVARLERVVVTAADGTQYDLGRPGTWAFKIRLALYKKRRGIA